MSEFGELAPGQAVVAYLQDPKEKVWGILVSMGTAGITLRGLDMAAFDDWVRQQARGDEPMIGLMTRFYPMHRVQRLEGDETVGPVVSCSERFTREVGISISEALGLDQEDG